MDGVGRARAAEAAWRRDRRAGLHRLARPASLHGLGHPRAALLKCAACRSICAAISAGPGGARLGRGRRARPGSVGAAHPDPPLAMVASMILNLQLRMGSSHRGPSRAPHWKPCRHRGQAWGRPEGSSAAAWGWCACVLHHQRAGGLARMDGEAMDPAWVDSPGGAGRPAGTARAGECIPHHGSFQGWP